VAQTSILKPGGNFNLSIGISPAGVTVILPAIGASFEVAMSGPMPCFHAGAGAAATGAALGASALGGGAVAQPCKAKSDEASTVMDVNEIYFCFIFVFLLLMTWFYERVRLPNLVSFDRYGYGRRLWFLPRYIQ
jgi:hypothetical protein